MKRELLPKETYVGKTNESLKRRLSRHRYDVRSNRTDAPLHTFMRSLGEDNFYLFPIDYTFSKKNAKLLESAWIRSLEAGLNALNPINKNKKERKRHKTYYDEKGNWKKYYVTFVRNP